MLLSFLTPHISSLFHFFSFLIFSYCVEMTSVNVMFVQAILQVLSGVEVLVCTPDCLLQLIDKTVAQLDSLAYLVLRHFN